MRKDVSQPLSGQTVLFMQEARSMIVQKVCVTIRNVHGLELGLPVADDGADHPSSGLIRAPDERGEPAWRHENVVVYKDDIVTFGVAEAEIARLVWPEVTVGTDEKESFLLRLGFEIALDPRRRAPVHVDQPKG